MVSTPVPQGSCSPSRKAEALGPYWLGIGWKFAVLLCRPTTLGLCPHSSAAQVASNLEVEAPCPPEPGRNSMSGSQAGCWVCTLHPRPPAGTEVPGSLGCAGHMAQRPPEVTWSHSRLERLPMARQRQQCMGRTVVAVGRWLTSWLTPGCE